MFLLGIFPLKKRHFWGALAYIFFIKNSFTAPYPSEESEEE